MKALCKYSPQARHHFTRFDQVDLLVRASEAAPDTFQTPPSRVNNLSRSLYRQVRDALHNKRLRSDKILGVL